MLSPQLLKSLQLAGVPVDAVQVVSGKNEHCPLLEDKLPLANATTPAYLCTPPDELTSVCCGCSELHDAS